jgi:hypothetical protein
MDQRDGQSGRVRASQRHHWRAVGSLHRAACHHGRAARPSRVDGEHEEELQIGDTAMWVRDMHDWLRRSKRINLLPSKDGRRQ